MPTVLRAKCVIVGDSCVGKSAVTQVFHSDGSHFPKNYQMTTGVELCTKTVTVPETHDQVEIFLYDSAGKETFSDLMQKYWSQPSMILLVYDVTNETSFNSCEKWLERVRSQKPEVPFPSILLANKTDLHDRRVVSPKMGEDFAAQNGLDYFECSAKDMENVDQVFLHLAKCFHQLYKERVEFFKTLA